MSCVTHVARRVVAVGTLAMVAVALAARGLGAEPNVARPVDDRPNILFIYLDDFGWRDASYMGSDFYETPHLDRLAREGIYFTDGYACAANCAPSRACLLTGQYSPRHRIFNVGTGPRGDAAHRRLEHIEGTSELAFDVVTWAEALRDVGYDTGMFGKWHLENSPQQHGFRVAFEFNKLPGFPRKGHQGADGEYLADVLTDLTIEFIRESRETPWCAYLAHFAVHTPLQPKRELLDKYRAKPPGRLHQHVVMATMIQAVDDGVGRIVDVLRQIGALENTLIVFSSDNGGYGPATDMDPLWGYKGTYYEGGIRVPYFFHWPRRVQPGRSSSEPIIGVDIFPTLLEIAEADQPASQPSDGRSLLPLLDGSKDTLGERTLYWHFPAYLQSYQVIDEQRDPLFRTRPCSIARRGQWKLHEYFETSEIELYDLSRDIRERHDMATSEPGLAAAMLRDLQQWRRNVNAPVPTALNSEFRAEAEQRAIDAAIDAHRRRGE